MKLSTKGRYGLRAMVELAVRYSEGQVTLANIAQKQQISESYLEQLLNVLKKAGLVNSARGHQGGYVLAMNPKEITVTMIMDVLEGSLAPVHCIADCPPTQCERFDICATKNVWKKVKDSIYEVINSITLKELADEQEFLNQLQSDKIKCESDSNSKFGLIIIKNAKKEIDNIAFIGKWLFEKERVNGEVNGKELNYSIALTEKSKFFALADNEEFCENNEYRIFSTLDELKASDFLPKEIIDRVEITLSKEEGIKFLDI